MSGGELDEEERTVSPALSFLALAIVGWNLLFAQKVGSHMPSMVEVTFIQSVGYKKLERLTRWLT